MHDMNKMQNEDKNPTAKGISQLKAENGKSRSYKYGKLHAGCYNEATLLSAFSDYFNCLDALAT